MNGNELVDAVLAALNEDLGLDDVSAYAVASIVFLTVQVCEANGLMQIDSYVDVDHDGPTDGASNREERAA